MISIHAIDSGTFNVVGISEGLFNLQGNLDLAELMELRDRIEETIEAVIDSAEQEAS